jgi:hypothetical protein
VPADAAVATESRSSGSAETPGSTRGGGSPSPGVERGNDEHVQPFNSDARASPSQTNRKRNDVVGSAAEDNTKSSEGKLLSVLNATSACVMCILRGHLVGPPTVIVLYG